MTNSPATQAFAVGKTYSTRSACDHNCVFRFAIVKRTAKMITFTYLGKQHTRGVRVRDGVEVCLPLGSYSMAPVITANDVAA